MYLVSGDKAQSICIGIPCCKWDKHRLQGVAKGELDTEDAVHVYPASLGMKLLKAYIHGAFS